MDVPEAVTPLNPAQQRECINIVILAFLRPEFSVFVGDLASEVDDYQLHQVFKKYPSCKGAKVVTDQYGYSRYVSSQRRTRQRDGLTECILLTILYIIYKFHVVISGLNIIARNKHGCCGVMNI